MVRLRLGPSLATLPSHMLVFTWPDHRWRRLLLLPPTTTWLQSRILWSGKNRGISHEPVPVHVDKLEPTWASAELEPVARPAVVLFARVGLESTLAGLHLPAALAAELVDVAFDLEGQMTITIV